MGDWHPNHLSFDVNTFQSLAKQIYSVHLDALSEKMVNVVRGWVYILGNGAYKQMKLFTVFFVKETKREITNDHITLEVGIDASGLPEEGQIRIGVVLHGNQGSGPLKTKPGIATYGKYVTDKRVHVKKGTKPEDLPKDFNQYDVIEKIEENVKKEMTKHINDYLEAVANDISRLNWFAFIKGG